MRRPMEYVRWELGNWRTQWHGREISIFTGAKEVAHYMWQSWKRGAFLVLVLAFLPILFPLALFLSFVGFICAVPLLCGVATYYLFFRNFSLPLCITEFIYPSYRPAEGLIASSQSAEDGMLHSVPSDVQEAESRQEETLLQSSTIGEGDANEVPSGASDAKTILLLECELLGNERIETDNRKYQNTQNLNVPNDGNHKSGVGSGLSLTCHSNAVFLVGEPRLLLPRTKLKSQYEQWKDEESQSLHGIGDEISAEALERMVSNVLGDGLSKSGQRRTQTSGVVFWGKGAEVVDTNRIHTYSSPAVSSVGIVREKACTPERRHVAETNWTFDTNISHGNSILEVRGEHPGSEPVFTEHTANIASTGESSETSRRFRRCASDRKNCQARNRSSTGNVGVMTGGAPCSNMQTPGKKFKDYTLKTDLNKPPSLGLSTTSCAEVLHCKPFEERCTNAPHESPPRLPSFISVECTEASVKSISPAFSDSALKTSEALVHADSESDNHMVRRKYWRDEVEDSVSSSAIAKAACIENLISEASEDLACLKSCKCDAEKVMNRKQDGDDLLECAQEAEVFSASQTSNSGQYKENMVEGENGRIGLAGLRFASPLLTHPRRLSFSNVLADDNFVSPGSLFCPGEYKASNDFTPDCKPKSVSTSFSSDYTWPSEYSDQGFEFLSTRRAALEESYVDTTSSSVPYEEEINLEPGTVSDSPSSFPTADQLTEDWETRRKRWEEESTLGRLVPPLSPYMEAHSVEARSICNPLFEFSTPSPPLKKLKTRDANHIFNSPTSLYTRFSKRHDLALLPESPQTHAWSSGSTPSPHPFRLQKRKSDMDTLPLDGDIFDLATSMRRHARPYSASFTERVEPGYSSEFEGLLGYWWRRDKMAHSLTSSPRLHSLTSSASSPAELAHKIREEIDSMQILIGQEMPPQYSLWKEVEALSLIVGMKLPYMGDMSDISKARQGLDRLKIAVESSCDVE